MTIGENIYVIRKKIIIVDIRYELQPLIASSRRAVAEPG